MARGIVLGIRPVGLHTVLVMNQTAHPVAHVEATRDLGVGLQVRAGLHTGECERIGDKVGGTTVHIGARVVAHANASESLVSSTVKDLVAGSGIQFLDRGSHRLNCCSCRGMAFWAGTGII